MIKNEHPNIFQENNKTLAMRVCKEVKSKITIKKIMMT
jgi:hypothetical protein